MIIILYKYISFTSYAYSITLKELQSLFDYNDKKKQKVVTKTSQQPSVNQPKEPTLVIPSHPQKPSEPTIEFLIQPNSIHPENISVTLPKIQQKLTDKN